MSVAQLRARLLRQWSAATERASFWLASRAPWGWLCRECDVTRVTWLKSWARADLDDHWRQAHPGRTSWQGTVIDRRERKVS